MDIEEVIEKIGRGSLRETARKLNLHPATVSNWRMGGKIPAWRHDHIKSVAARMGEKLSGKSTGRKAA